MTTIEIPASELSAEVLRGIIEEFVLQEGTDYGQGEYTLDQKVAQVMKQLSAGKAKIVYDDETESCGIVS